MIITYGDPWGYSDPREPLKEACNVPRNPLLILKGPPIFSPGPPSLRKKELCTE